jgi:platelet-activating factor acetylhydrolase
MVRNTGSSLRVFFIAALTITSLVIAGLPEYSGPYGVGTIQLENDAQDPRIITNARFKTSGQPALRLDTVLVTLFYPVDPNTKSSKDPHPWLPEPRDLIAKGLSIGLGGSVPPDLIQAAFSVFANNLTIPAQVDVPMLSVNSSKFPVMVFSHGDFGMSDWYSQYYGEMASRGVVIVATTHRDGSSPATTVRFQNGTSYNLTAFTKDDVL